MDSGMWAVVNRDGSLCAPRRRVRQHPPGLIHASTHSAVGTIDLTTVVSRSINSSTESTPRANGTSGTVFVLLCGVVVVLPLAVAVAASASTCLLLGYVLVLGPKDLIACARLPYICHIHGRPFGQLTWVSKARQCIRCAVW